MSFVPEIDTLYRWMTVEEMAELCSAKFFFEDWQSERARELVDFMKLNLQRKWVRCQRNAKRLRLALGPARDADLILLDEPLSGIDPASRTKSSKALFGSSVVRTRPLSRLLMPLMKQRNS